MTDHTKTYDDINGMMMECWFDNKNQLHRNGSPAVIWENGECHWYFHGKFHREDGPAVEHHGYNEYYRFGKLHREDGPAIEWVNHPDSNQWWLNDEVFNYEEDWKIAVDKLHGKKEKGKKEKQEIKKEKMISKIEGQYTNIDL